MSEYYMGQELTQPELPANSPRPAETPPDGIIVTDVAPDGWTRRYLYKSYMGQAEELLLREIPPVGYPSETMSDESAHMAGAAVPITENAPYMEPQRQPPNYMQTASVPSAPAPMMQTVPMRSMNQPVMPAPVAAMGEGQRNIPTVRHSPVPPGGPQSLMLRNSGDPLRMASAALGMSRTPTPSIQMGGPTTLMNKNLALQTGATPRIGPAGLGASQRARITAPTSNALTIAPRLGQIQPPAPPPPPAGSAPPPPLEPVATKCPGPVEMTDGHVIEPQDYIKLSDLCELVPFLMEAELQAKSKQAAGKGGLAPGQPLSLVGQPQGGMSAVGGGSPFGGMGGGGGGGGFGGFGGGGGPGPAGPAGIPGTAGPAGPPGPGTATDFLVK